MSDHTAENDALDTCVHPWHDGRDPGPCPGCGFVRPQDQHLTERQAMEVVQRARRILAGWQQLRVIPPSRSTNA